MRILAVSHPCVTDVNQQFYAELEALGHRVHLIVPSNFRTEYSLTQLSRWPSFYGTIEQRRVGFRQSVPLHFYQSNLRSTIKQFRPDVLFAEEEPYSASAWQAFYASRNLPMKRIIYSAQNIYKKYPQPFRWMERYVLAKADMAAVVSKEVGSVLLQKQYKGKLMPFPLGVDSEQFRPLPEEGMRIRTELGLQNHFVIGYIGRLVEEKGIYTLIDALPLLAASNIKLLFIGNGPLLEELNKAKERFPDSIIITEHIKHRDIQKWINAMDVLALPSRTKSNWREQFGRVLIEAMFCKVPVIGSNSGEIPVLIDETGGGWIFPEGNSYAFTQLVERLIKDREEIRNKAEVGYRNVCSRFSKGELAKSFALEIQHLSNQPERLAK
jgi:glycosyltransferase involved in cell wall biosynthesis